MKFPYLILLLLVSSQAFVYSASQFDLLGFSTTDTTVEALSPDGTVMAGGVFYMIENNRYRPAVYWINNIAYELEGETDGNLSGMVNVISKDNRWMAGHLRQDYVLWSDDSIQSTFSLLEDYRSIQFVEFSDDNTLLLNMTTPVADDKPSSITVLWSDDEYTRLPGLEASGYSAGSAISADGIVVVGVDYLDETPIREWPFNTSPVRWVNGTKEQLPVPQGYVSGSAIDVSDDGSVIIGGAYNGTRDNYGDYFSQPVIWRDGQPEIIEVPDDFPGRFSVYAISDDGRIVIGYMHYNDYAGEGYRYSMPFIWDETNGFRSLYDIYSTSEQSQIDSLETRYALDLEIIGVSDDALTIIGVSLDNQLKRYWKMTLDPVELNLNEESPSDSFGWAFHVPGSAFYSNRDSAWIIFAAGNAGVLVYNNTTTGQWDLFDNYTGWTYHTGQGFAYSVDLNAWIYYVATPAESSFILYFNFDTQVWTAL